ncbi:hypothetical protein KCH_37290 [Kitasatospora cheerisanensis KCTC 2395]|uniref:Uncharacterized protein n=1 Tax=Kitasatospora cheerisanensis KCTC 2395 TaxID=1348663 RepID=A0A066YTT7_9ACTN|nr:hypothetical protein KCH_37290 [Kitasatospora cheerisanensis KCTC 2395]
MLVLGQQESDHVPTLPVTRSRVARVPVPGRGVRSSAGWRA